MLVDVSSRTSDWRVGDASAPVVDIAVPYADENRNHVLLSTWRSQAGDSLPAPPLTLPRHSEGTFRIRIQAQNMFDLPIEDQYSDAIAGKTGGPGGHHGDLVVTHITLSGEVRFSARNHAFGAEAGTLIVRRNDEPWDFQIARGTRAAVVGLPTSAIRFPRNTLAVTAAQTSPAARLLVAHLRLFAEVSGELGPAAAAAARDATSELFQGLVNDQVMDDARFTPAIFDAARRYIEQRLVDPDLNAQAIAQELHVSVRTLYRVFAQQATSSVMTYVRRRRLERARAELISTRLILSEIATHWHFSDSSHFAKAYKKHFGETPSASRSRRSA